ncbi:MAG: hypothetical protein AAF518_14395 [Spirochaetota bacterium]
MKYLLTLTILSMTLLYLPACNLPVPYPYPYPFEEESEEDDDGQNLQLLGLALLAASAFSSTSSAALTNGRVAVCSGTGGRPVSEKNTVSIAFNNATYTTGIDQVSSNNQDAFVYKTVSDNLEWCYYYDDSAADTKGELLAVNSSHIFVAFSTDGGNASFSSSTGAVQTTYGSGGGPLVTFLAKLDSDGSILNATYLAARLTDGSTVNTLRPSSLSATDTQVVFTGTSAYDAGVASDSLEPGVICDSGSTRQVNLNVDLNTINSTSCF